MSEEIENNEEQQEQNQENKPFSYVEACGGPLVCVSCAMKYAQAYFNIGKGVWADYYHRHAIKLRNEFEITRLQEENKKLTFANAELEKQMWKVHVNNTGS